MPEFERCSYLTKDRSLDIDFVFMNCGNEIGWRIYIITSIDYKTRSHRSVDAHWLKDTNETYPYICWSEKIESLQAAKEVAVLWSDCTAYYIQHGGNFQTIASRI